MYTKYNIAVVGLGYVGFPLFCQFLSKYKCKGLDIDLARLNENRNALRSHLINTQEIDLQSIETTHQLTNKWVDISDCNFYIVTVQTPTDNNDNPDLSALNSVCRSLGSILKKGDIVVFESTVYPGATEEFCIPILQEVSGLQLNKNFYVGYSPERINIGDSKHKMTEIPKIISGSTNEVTNEILKIYQSVWNAKLIMASSIKVAEAAKMYENVQRDVLIALANEYAEYCREESININEVTSCASSKWNFSTVNPGLVGGHCISVDPYYLLDRCKFKGIKMPLVSQARQINEYKANYVADRIASYMDNVKHIKPSISHILLLGFAYKPNCEDIRNTKVINVINELKKRGYHVDCCDHLVDTTKALTTYNINILSGMPSFDKYDLIIDMVHHSEFDFLQDKNKVLKLDYFL